MVTSRPVPQQTAQIFSPLAGQKRAGLRFSQTGQNTNSPRQIRAIQQNTPSDDKRQKRYEKPLWFWRGQFRRERGFRWLASLAFLDGLAEEIFNLTVDAAQFVLRPGFELRPERRIDAQKKGFSFHHPYRSVVQLAGVDHRMHLGFPAEDNHEIADHGGFALVVEHDHMLIGEIL